MTRAGSVLAALLLAGCSDEPATEVPPLPEPTAETTNNLMAMAEEAAANAASGTELKEGSRRSGGETTNEVRP